METLAGYFSIPQNRSSVRTEIRAGITTFMAMAYIIFTNPAILSIAGVPFSGAVIATCISAGLLCILMGLVTNYPMCMAPGMGLNAVITFQIVHQMGFSWQVGMGVVVLEGLIVLLLSATALRTAMMDAIPPSLKRAIAIGIGLFITFIGLQAGGFVDKHAATMVTHGDFTHPVCLLATVGLLLTGFLLILRVPGALLLGILGTALLGMLPMWRIPAGVGAPNQVVQFDAAFERWGALVPFPRQIVDMPRDWSTFFKFDLRAALSLKLLPVIFAFMMTDFFDTIGTAIGVGAKAGFLERDGRIKRIRPLLIVDSLGAVLGGMFGCSSNTCYIESSAGAAEGGRTGLTAVTCGILFLLAVFFAPLVAVVGGGVQVAPGVVLHPVTSAALILVGFFMLETIRDMDWKDLSESIPAFLIIIVLPLTFSITYGIGAGFIAYVVWKAASGKAREIKPLLWVAALLFLAVFALPLFERAIAR